MVKTYQLMHDGDFGQLLKIAPVTTNDFLNKVTCLQVNGTSDDRVKIQSILPDVKNFEFQGIMCFFFSKFIYLIYYINRIS